jgi:glycosyltransferase involved in cell wall biosynthesis
MRVLLLPHLPDALRLSMDKYATQLQRHLLGCLAHTESVSRFWFPQSLNLCTKKAGKLDRYWEQYVRYQTAVKVATGDVFHITDHAYAHLAWSLPGDAVVITFHDALLPRLAEGSLPVSWKPHKSILAQKVCLWVSRRVAHIVADSNAAKSELERFLPSSHPPVSVVYPGVEESYAPIRSVALRRSWTARFGLDDSIKVLCVGRIDPHKNIEGALKALAMLVHGKHRPAVLVKVGSSLNLKQKRLAEKLHVHDRIRYLGCVRGEEMPHIYGVCDVLLHLSFHEGFGLPVLEALACGLPVVASNIPSLREVAEDSALFVDPLDPKAAVEAILKVADRGISVDALRESGRERAREFRWEGTAQAMLEVYRKVFTQNRQNRKLQLLSEAV